ncbi:MAG TPA: hypothetical protein P5083_00405 [Candidatus Paceibacterota bacterium]|jgi:uncharacterized membrane protein|nr:hypothetical protein [Candidatus Pacearchaeota archaeon]HRR94591.1 hypothetical protein [Candidatus Paceibacterota bacterium]HRU20675.1 hypothetical protein [Candidatus Paceibacterota bacterium]
MEAWLLYGLAASLCWGTDAIMSKIVTSDKYLNVPAMHSSLLMLAGIASAFIIYFLLQSKDLNLTMKILGIILLVAIFIYAIFALKQANIAITWPVIFFGIMQGLLWGTGMVFTFLAFAGGADAAKLVPIYNTNTLVSVLLGLAFLHELGVPGTRMQVISGALLIVIGSILVSN